MYIRNLNEDKISVSKKVKEEMTRLRTNVSLRPCIPFLYQYAEDSYVKILFQNVRSLHLHVQDVAADYNIQAAYINIFAETALCVKDQNKTLAFGEFNLYRNDWKLDSNARTNYGMAVYVK